METELHTFLADMSMVSAARSVIELNNIIVSISTGSAGTIWIIRFFISPEIGIKRFLVEPKVISSWTDLLSAYPIIGSCAF